MGSDCGFLLFHFSRTDLLPPCAVWRFGSTQGENDHTRRFLAYSESHRLTVCATAALLISRIAWGDSRPPDVPIGFLYLFPVLFSASVLNIRRSC